MAGTRSGTKRKADTASSPDSASKRGKPSSTSQKEQKTLEETLPSDDKIADELSGDKPTTENGVSEANGNNDHGVDSDEKMQAEQAEGDDKSGAKVEDNGAAEKPVVADARDIEGANGNALEKVKASEGNDGKTHKDNAASKSGTETNVEPVGEAVEIDDQRKAAMPSNVLEKGVIYFFTRGRVGVDDPDSVQDLARSYFVLRPLPIGAKLSDGAIQDMKNNRLIALPKKVWPKSGKDRFMAFVEKAKTDIASLKEEFFSGSEYSTKTTGTRHTPEVTPVGEGVYAITSTGGGQGTTHLVYMLTIPSEVSEVQSDLGLAEKGSFVLSLKNPKSSGPANAQLPQGPEYPESFYEEFRGRSWMPVQPKHIDYANAQMLLIGESFDSSSNLEPTPKDEKNSKKETPQEELQKLEEEDETRVENLKGDDSIFADLGLDSKAYPKVMTTW